MEPAGALHVLFLCTGNSARSLLAEAMLERLGAPRFRAFSAGSDPAPGPHPMTLETLAELGYETTGLYSKSWRAFSGPEAPRLDLVITVCDSAAAEACPIWTGSPITTHWGLPDPASVRGSERERRAAFRTSHDRLIERIEALVALDPAALEPGELASRLEAIGRL